MARKKKQYKRYQTGGLTPEQLYAFQQGAGLAKQGLSGQKVEGEQIGSAIGSTAGFIAGNAIAPGLGLVLSPLGGMLGSAIGGSFEHGGNTPGNLKPISGGKFEKLKEGVYISKGRSHRNGGIVADTNMDNTGDLELEGGELYFEDEQYIVNKDLSKKYLKQIKNLPDNTIGNETLARIKKNAIAENEAFRKTKEVELQTAKYGGIINTRVIKNPGSKGSYSVVALKGDPLMSQSEARLTRMLDPLSSVSAPLLLTHMKHGGLIETDENQYYSPYLARNTYEYPPQMQGGGVVSHTDSLNAAANRVIPFETTMGASGGAPAPMYAGRQEDYLKIVNKIPEYGSAANKAQVADWLWRAGWDWKKQEPTINPKAYIVGEYIRKHDKYKPEDWDENWGWRGRKEMSPADINKIYNEKVKRLPENEQVVLTNLAKDWFFKNRYTGEKDLYGRNPDGSFIRDEYGAISRDYKSVWAPGIRNLYPENILKPFNKEDVQIGDTEKIDYDEYYKRQTIPRKQHGGVIPQYTKGGKWIQKATASIKRRGTEGVCTGDKFGSDSCPPGSKRYNLAKTFRKMARNRRYGGPLPEYYNGGTPFSFDPETGTFTGADFTTGDPYTDFNFPENSNPYRVANPYYNPYAVDTSQRTMTREEAVLGTTDDDYFARPRREAGMQRIPSRQLSDLPQQDPAIPLKYTSRREAPVAGGFEKRSKTETGGFDYGQLIPYAPAAFNIATGLSKTKEPPALKSPYGERAAKLLGERRIDTSPLMRQIDREAAVTRYNIPRVGNISGGQYLSSLINLGARTQTAKADAMLKAYDIENTYRLQEAQGLIGLGEAERQAELQRSQIRDRYESTRAAQLSTGIGQISDIYQKQRRDDLLKGTLRTTNYYFDGKSWKNISTGEVATQEEVKADIR